MNSGNNSSEDDEEMPACIEIKEEGDTLEVSDGTEESESEEQFENGENEESMVKTYLPSRNLDGENVDLECDESAYVMYHQAKTGTLCLKLLSAQELNLLKTNSCMPNLSAHTGAPCLSFDIIRDNLGDDRADKFPLTLFIVSGTQAERINNNNLIVMKMSNLMKTNVKSQEEEEESESEEEFEDDKPELESALIHHSGCVNRVKATNIGGKPLAASWSETGKVFLWDLSHPLQAVNNHHSMSKYIQNKEAPQAVFSFSGHQGEGFAMDWSNLKPGVLATGDCNKNIHLWKPQEGGSWHVDQRPYSAHTASVEDIQWSPNEDNVLASCSVDKSIRIWDVRAAPHKACMLTTNDAHDSDVNVISWNETEPFIISGGDDGKIKVWDLRKFAKNSPICLFKYHVAPITSVEWHPTDSSVFAACSSDDQLTLWDLAVERDYDEEAEEKIEPEVLALPPQLLFIHQGQKDIKELHWHPQLPGVVISTAQSGMNVFRTISV